MDRDEIMRRIRSIRSLAEEGDTERADWEKNRLFVDVLRAIASMVDPVRERPQDLARWALWANKPGAQK